MNVQELENIIKQIDKDILERKAKIKELKQNIQDLIAMKEGLEAIKKDKMADGTNKECAHKTKISMG